MPFPAPRPGAAALALALAAGSAAAVAGPAAAAGPGLVISEVYGGGGNSGATYTTDFVELVNTGSTAVDVSGWSVQYASASGTSWQVTPLSGTVAPGARYLVAQASGAGGTTPLPPADATGGTALGATSGKVALVTSTTALGCATACAAAPGVRDLVGYGTANDAEGAPAPAASNTTSVARAANGADTDDNAADLTAGAPTPAGGGGAGSGGPDPVAGLRIHDVQGAAHLSPHAGDLVADVPGVVTAVGPNRFWVQDPSPDADPATSEAILVFTGTAPTVAVGDAVTVTGTVTEYRAGGTSSANLTTTELTSPVVTTTATAQPLPAAALVGPGGLRPPGEVIDDDATGSVEEGGTFDPARDGIDFWESLEGMRLRLDDAPVVGPTNSYGESVVVPRGSGVRTARGGIVAREGDFNPERLVVGDALVALPTADVGDRFAGATVGVLDYDFGNFVLQPTSAPVLADGGLRRETTTAARGGELAVATFNVENLDPGDPQATFDRLAGVLVQNLRSPDVVALEEVQDDTGPTDDGVVTAGRTISQLLAAIRAAGGPVYSYRQIDPVDRADGGEPGGNIRNVLLFRTDRGLRFVDTPGGSATTATSVVTDRRGDPHLSASPGRIAPADAAWTSSRKPLAAEFSYRGRSLFVVANHFNSKGGDQPLFGRYQPPAVSSEVQRHQQAQLVRDFVTAIQRRDRDAAVVVLGDLNDFEFSTTADILVGDGSLVDLPRTLPQQERYTYVYQGNSEVLDHILISRGLARRGYAYDVVHVTSEFADQVSDHDPQVVRLRVAGRS
ncbi:lamin tail domain-containing protein [Kineococcus glutinatus]|uniref:Endonuclease/exonuclease/phosphatase family protein n=1 Tax=Kineococcus glutinatus TaxID=1070872 RepID=A0ABP9HTP8_9ACTN